MSSFRVVEHRVPAAHLRGFTRATSQSEEDVLTLAVKQYIPLNNPNPKPGDVTILATHANAFPKELYEPLWEDALAQAAKHSWKIRSIWMADVAWQGESGNLNAKLLGNDPSWDDHPRDLANLINLKRDEMPRPIIGVGHSMGGAHLVKLAMFHPSLFTTLILFDPIIQRYGAEPIPGGPNPSLAQLSTFRRSIWKSREDARSSFLKSPFYKAWDQRCLEKWIQFGLRDCPNHEYPDASPPQVSLATSVAQEVWTYLRPNFEGYGTNGKPINRMTHPDVDPRKGIVSPFYRSEPYEIFKQLPHLRPSCLFVLGGASAVQTWESCEERLRLTGTGSGGSGGQNEGRARNVTFEGIGHLVPLEAPARSAQVFTEWLNVELQTFRMAQDHWEANWWSKPLQEKQTVSEEWKTALGSPTKAKKKPESKM